MHERRVVRLGEERAVRTGEDRHIRAPGRLQDGEGVADDVVKRGVAVHAGDAEELDLRMACSEQQRERVVDAGVDVEDEAGHARTVTPWRSSSTRRSGRRTTGSGATW